MKKQTIFSILLVATMAIFFTGCGIFSLHPLYHQEDLIMNTSLIGTWQNTEDEGTFVMIDTLKDCRYKFVLIDKGDTVSFVMGLLRLKDQYFIDLYPPEECSFFGGENCDMLENMFRNYIPAHTFLKFDFQGDNIVLTEFDNERLIKLFQQNRIRLSHEMIGYEDDSDDYVVITASTDDLQKFISRYANDREAFNAPETYHRL